MRPNLLKYTVYYIMYIRRISVVAAFDQMRSYLHLVHASLDDEQERFFASVKGIHSTIIDEDQKQETLDLLHNEFIQVSHEFPRLLYSSFLVSWYSFIEHQLLQLCDDLKLTVTISVRQHDRYSKGIQRARQFLKEAATYEIPDDFWQELTKIQQIRNKIVHEGGELCYFTTQRDGENTVPLRLEDISIYEEEHNTIYLNIDNNLYQYLYENALLRYGGRLYIDPPFEYCLGLVDFGKGLFTNIWGALDLT